MTTLDNILDYTGGERFYRFGNADGKYWVMPARGMRTAMHLYQPSGIKGKTVKALLPCLHWLPLVRKAVHASMLHCHLNKELHELLCKVFNTYEIELAIFEGTPSVHQKITMQVSSGKRILGYCKLSNCNSIKELFEKETVFLNVLAEKGVKNIPQALYCGTTSCGIHIFVQSTIKTCSSRVVHEWSILQEEFISQLYEKTRQALSFEDSDYCKALASLKEHLHWLPSNIDKETVSRAIARVFERFGNKDAVFSACHCDFTPWNMFVEKGELFVFDFEYAAMSYPPGLDRYHFFTQTAVFEKHWSANEIISYTESDEGKWIDKELYTMYLLDVIGRFTIREKGKVCGAATTPFKLWGELLSYLTDDKPEIKEQ